MARSQRRLEWSKEALVNLVEKYYGNKIQQRLNTTIPLPDEWFDVDPVFLINQESFQKKRSNWSEERTRLIILEAFEEAKRNPERYLKKFRTMYPSRKREDGRLTEAEFEEIACKIGDHQVDWVEKAFEWAQCISNDELIGWKTTCSILDSSNWIRVIKGKDGKLKGVGAIGENAFPTRYGLPTDINDFDDNVGSMEPYQSVPSIVSYDFSYEQKAIKDAQGKITLIVDGEERVFIEDELITIIRYDSDSKKKMIENEWFDVNPDVVVKELKERMERYYKESWENEFNLSPYMMQQKHFIECMVQSFREVEKDPEKYAKRFKVMFPTKNWPGFTEKEKCSEIACKIGHHQLDEIELGLLFGQLIVNGNHWRELAEYNTDTSDWYKLVISKEGNLILVGDSWAHRHSIFKSGYRAGIGTLKRHGVDGFLDFAVPLIASYEVE